MVYILSLVVLLTFFSKGLGFTHHVRNYNVISNKFSSRINGKFSSIALNSPSILHEHRRTNSDAEGMESCRRDADAIFCIIDKDGDGSITLEELTIHLRMAGYTPIVVKSIFGRLDRNRDGLMSRKEFQSAFFLFDSLRSAKGFGNSGIILEKEVLKDADSFFQNVDINGNGSIDISELSRYLNPKFSQKAIENIFQIIDDNNDGEVSNIEVREAFLRYSALRVSMMQIIKMHDIIPC